MTLAAPSFEAPPYRVTGRAALTVAYESDPTAIQEVLPEPLLPDGATVTLGFVSAAESPFGAYRACTISIAAKFESRSVRFCNAIFIDQEGPIYAGREIWGLPATRGVPDLILGENRVAGMLDLDYGGQLHASIPVATPEEAGVDLSAATQLSCKLIPGTDGTPAIAQLVALQPVDVVVAQYWSGPVTLEAEAGGPLDTLPVVKALTGQYVLGDLTLPRGRVVHDYLAAAK